MTPTGQKAATVQPNAMTKQGPPGEIALDLPREKLPRHIAVIMDGNGRWAQRRGLPRIEGHRRGVAAVRRIVETCARWQIEYLTLFCFSSENWKRPSAEWEALMCLLEQFVVEERRRIMEQNIRMRFFGRREGLPPGVLRELDKTVAFSEANTGLTLCLAINYGGRAELVDAVKRIAEQVATGQLSIDQIDDEQIAANLYTAGIPDPDLLIRTAGEMRISNFLLWQISYAELWVTRDFWPDFTEVHLREALRAFACRDRRFGGLKCGDSL